MSKPAEQLDNVMDNIPYFDKWQMGEGIPIIKTFFVQDLRKVELKPWDRSGGYGAFINMEGAEGATGAYVSEIPAGKKLNPVRHLRRFAFRSQGTGRHDDLERQGRQANFRMAGRQPFRAAAQFLVSALQRLWQRAGEIFFCQQHAYRF